MAKALKKSIYTPKQKTSSADSKGRVVLGVAYANKMFRVSEQPDGNLLLEPVVTVHEREAWLYKNPEALSTVRKGIEESKTRKGKDLGSFSKFVVQEED